MTFRLLDQQILCDVKLADKASELRNLKAGEHEHEPVGSASEVTLQTTFGDLDGHCRMCISLQILKCDHQDDY